MKSGEVVIDNGWLERLGWLLAASAISGFGAWLWASFRKVDKAAHEKDMERIEKQIEHRFDEFELRVVEPIRKRNSQFEMKLDEVSKKLGTMNDLLIKINTKLEVQGK